MLNNNFYVIMATDEKYDFDWYAGHDYRAHGTGLPSIKCDLRTCDHYQTYRAAISAWKKNKQYLRDETLSNYRISKITIKETMQANLDVIDNTDEENSQG